MRAGRLHQRLVSALEIPPDHVPRWLFAGALLMIVLVGAFARARLALSGLGPDEMFAGQPLLTSTDGYVFAAGVGHTLGDAWGAGGRLPRPDDHALVALGAALELLGLQREAIFAWLPVVLAPLAVVPLALIGRALGRSTLGLSAALGAVLAPTYVARSSVGYFDTDMFAVGGALVVALFLVRLFAPCRPRSRPRSRAPAPAATRSAPGSRSRPM